MERFISKRNQVFLREDGLVVKRFSRSGSAAVEAGLIRKYHRLGVSVPRVLDQSENEIVMEYIQGETIPDFLERMDTEPDNALMDEAAQGLCQWFKRFYEAVSYTASGEIRGDVNGRNFIIAKDRVASVDFEERMFGAAEQDIGRLLAFVQTYDHIRMSIKNRFVYLLEHGFIEQLNLSEQEIRKQYQEELIAIRMRRS